MPRVHTATRKRAVLKRPMTCRHCHEEIAVGQSYFTWQRRYGGPQYLHTTCRRPRPTELSDRKTAQIEEAVLDVEWPNATFDMPSDGSMPEAEAEGYIDSLRDALSPVADAASEVGQEYESSADNMPESLQYGSQAEAMRDVASRLEDWASELQSWEPGSTEPDWPEREDEESDEDFAGRVQDAWDSWADDARSEAESALDDIPEYEG